MVYIMHSTSIQPSNSATSTCTHQCLKNYCFPLIYNSNIFFFVWEFFNQNITQHVLVCKNFNKQIQKMRMVTVVLSICHIVCDSMRMRKPLRLTALWASVLKQGNCSFRRVTSLCVWRMPAAFFLQRNGSQDFTSYSGRTHPSCWCCVDGVQLLPSQPGPCN